MKKSSVFFSFALSFALLLLGTGCNNHLSVTESNTLDYKRSEPKINYTLENISNTQDISLLRMKLLEQKSTTVISYSVHNSISRYTPYSFWRELYEFPMGVCLLPVSICGHVINVFSFGLFPYRFASAVTNTSFSAMNPFINVESESRFVEEIQKSSRKEIDRKDEVVIIPAANVPIAAGNRNIMVRSKSRDNGIVELSLLNPQGVGPTLNGNREIKIYVAGLQTPSEKVIIDRQRQNTLFRASRLLIDYNKKPSGQKLASVIIALEKMKLVNFAFELEKQELAKYENSPDFIKSFNQHISQKGK